jgi:hypothetical protein
MLVVFCEVEGVGMSDAGNEEGMFGYKDGTLTIAIGVTFWGFAFGREIEAQMLVLLLMFN